MAKFSSIDKCTLKQLKGGSSSSKLLPEAQEMEAYSKWRRVEKGVESKGIAALL